MKRITESQLRSVVREELNEILGLGRFLQRFKKQPQQTGLEELPEVEVIDEVASPEINEKSQQFKDNFFDTLLRISKSQKGIRAVQGVLMSLGISANVHYGNLTPSVFGFLDKLRELSKTPEVLGFDEHEVKKIIEDFESFKQYEGLQEKILKGLKMDYDNKEIPGVEELQKKMVSIRESKKRRS